ncbi:hypothetical protein SAMN02746042_01428 [Fructilactobacillus lindneri DSM 20690 = JCM 11027]|nr:hypothetical protein SAMN02746042_01428 [Fructilactobacillus lindneri DSM 20690 = JCM 11027]
MIRLIKIIKKDRSRGSVKGPELLALVNLIPFNSNSKGKLIQSEAR